MNIPRYTQLSALCEYVLYSMRRHEGLLQELQPAKAEHVLSRVYPYKIFYSAPDGIKAEKVDMPCIGFFPISMTSTVVHGAKGMDVTLGVQFLYQARHPDAGHTREGAAVHHLHLMWWCLSEVLQSPTTMMSAAGIYRLYPDAMDVIPPLANAVRGFDGTAAMSYKYPPYPYQGAVDLEEIRGTWDRVDEDGNELEGAILESITDGFNS